MERPLRSPRPAPPGIPVLLERNATERYHWPHAPELDRIEAECLRIEQRLVHASRRATILQLAVLEYRVRSVLDDLAARDNFRRLVEEARTARALAVQNGHEHLARRFARMLAEITLRRATADAAARRECTPALVLLLEEGEALERREAGLLVLERRLAGLEHRSARLCSPGELTILRQLVDRATSQGGQWSAAVQENILHRIESGVQRLESLMRDGDPVSG